ncbi:MAG: hypothetical protein LBQ09_03600 [Acidobacteriaceae bacterium]|nr:hypothetical protein [Acidobacteriaceae bacterium]
MRAFAFKRILSVTAAGAVACAGALVLTAQQPSKNDRPKLTLRAQPSVAVSPARVLLTAELQGGSDNSEEFYCPTITWEWGDETSSEATSDCDPYEAGKSKIRRRFSVQHVYRIEGSYKIYFHMKRNDKIIGSASTVIQVQPGLNSGAF